MLRPPLHPPQASHVLSDDETPSMVSDEDPEPPNEPEQDKIARTKRNKAKTVQKQRAIHHREAIQRFQTEMKNYEDEVARRRLEDEVARDNAIADQNRRHVEQIRNQAREGVSCNLEPDFIRMAGHNVYTTPLENILAIENALPTRTNPSLEDQRLAVLLQSAALQMKGHGLSIQNP